MRILINCPKSVDQFENFTCLINITFKNQNHTSLNVSIDFGDQTRQLLSIYTDAFLQINKTYIRTGNFTLRAQIVNYPLKVMTNINGNLNLFY